MSHTLQGQLEGKVALVTGSAAGIGEAIARRFGAEGAKVAVHGRESERDAGEAIAAALPGSRFFAAQVDQPEACQQLIHEVVAAYGRIDILVNNAAAITRSNLETTDAATFDYTMAVNCRAALLLMRAALPHFRAAGGACVLNIGSVNAYCGEANQLAYSISKGALMTLTRNLADALAGEQIRVNQINPGWVLTPNEYQLKIKEGLAANWPQTLPRSHAPSGRILAPEEIAFHALALVSDEGGPVSGAVIELEQYPFIGRNPVKEG